jgi:hypothetical protein
VAHKKRATPEERPELASAAYSALLAAMRTACLRLLAAAAVDAVLAIVAIGLLRLLLLRTSVDAALLAIATIDLLRLLLRSSVHAALLAATLVFPIGHICLLLRPMIWATWEERFGARAVSKKGAVRPPEAASRAARRWSRSE